MYAYGAVLGIDKNCLSEKWNVEREWPNVIDNKIKQSIDGLLNLKNIIKKKFHIDFTLRARCNVKVKTGV